MTPSPDTQPLVTVPTIAVVVSRFNTDITERLYRSACQVWQAHHSNDLAPETTWVPGAVELPIVAQRYAMSGHFDAIVCLGAVVQGASAHFEHVARLASDGCQQVALATHVPIIFGVLTTYNHEQAMERTQGQLDMGREAMETAFTTVESLRRIDQNFPTITQPSGA